VIASGAAQRTFGPSPDADRRLRSGSSSGSIGVVDAPAVEARRLVKRFGSLAAVDGVDLSLAPGRIYGLLGPNGSGKTTLIRLLTGLALATEGEAYVLGERMPSAAGLARIGYMTQSDGLYPELTVWENLRFFGALYGVTDREGLLDALRTVQLDDRTGAAVMDLSGGMRRRVSLACAMVHRPAVMFLDEPTVGIDPVMRVQFWDHFRQLAEAGTTILVSSHVMDEADRCHELILVRNGKVVDRGSGAEIRERAGTPSLEEAFLRYAERTGGGNGDAPPAGPGARP
jgi:ABC-2 type transport system ATP-binding protein